ncbi:MAG: AAA family ATPase [Chloroflexota bacterium]
METVRCAACGEENPARFRLCGACGTPLGAAAPPPPPPPDTIRCWNCGEQNPSRFRLCGYCGSPLAGAPAPAVPHEVRKVVTLIFSDLKDSTSLTERIDAEAINEVKERYFGAMATEIARHGGKIEKYIGDAIMAVFGLPRAHEDDAIRAVRAAAGMQEALGRLNEDHRRVYGVEIANRTGVNTGEVVANVDPGADQRLATGDAVNVAARLEQAAPPNEVLLGETTYEIARGVVEVESVEPLQLKGKAERVPAYRLVRITGPSRVTGRAREARLIGREPELASLRAAFADAAGARACRLVTLVGDAGVGKSRLIAEFVNSVATEATVLRSRCLSYGEGITFWPLREVTREAADIAEDDPPEVAVARLAELVADSPDADAIVDRVASATGLAATRFPVSELFWAARKLLERLAASRPLVVVIDDVHWGEPTFLELLTHLVDAVREAPILLVCSARHELLARDAAFGTGPGASRHVLAPLTAADAEQVVDDLLGDTLLDTRLRRRVVDAADGNPLFVEQLVSMLLDKGLLRHGDAGWQPTAELTQLAVPPTITALLAARLDDLDRGERTVLEPASVIGLVFAEPAIEELVPDGFRRDVRSNLGTLDRKQFVRSADDSGEDDAYRFRHQLIRDATYGSLLKRSRAQFHEKFVTWAERVNRERDRETEFEEILGYHLEQAFRYRTELGALDEDARDVGRRASAKLASAGRRAFARGDMPAAANLLRRAAAPLDPDDVARVEILIELGEALIELGDVAAVQTVIEDASIAAARLGDSRLAARATLVRLARALLASELEGGVPGAVREAERAIEVFDACNDHAGLARAWRFLIGIHGVTGRYEDAAAAARRSVDEARRAGDARIAARAAIGYATASLHGSTPAAEALLICEGLLDDTKGDRKAGATILGAMSALLAMQGEIERGRDTYRQYRDLLVDLGPSVTASSTSIESSWVEIMAGDLAAAERLLRRDDEELAAMGERFYRSAVVATLSLVLWSQARLAEADAAATLADELADPDDSFSQVVLRTTRARLRASEGKLDLAREIATGAVELAEATADIALQGDAWNAAADVALASGRPDDARVALETALKRYEQKGNRVEARRIESMLESMLV